MNFEDMQRLWREQGDELERARPVTLGPSDWAPSNSFLDRYTQGRWMELGFGTITLVLTAIVTVQHIGDARFVVTACAFAIYIAALMGCSLHQIVQTARLDSTQSLLERQRRVRKLQVFEYRSMKWAILCGIWMWLPGMIVLLRGCFGFDVFAKASMSWILSNFALGVVVSIIGQRLSRKYVERDDAGPAARQFLRFLAGKDLDGAVRELDELAAFERGD